MHELFFTIVLLYFCNKPIIATPHTIQINGSCDQTFKIDLFLAQVLRSCNHACACNIDVVCTWRYTHVYANTHMSLGMHGFACVS